MDEKINNTIVDYLIATPKALGILLFSFFSGHLWIYFVIYKRNNGKGKKYLKSKWSKLAIGLLYFIIILLPNYLIRNGFSDFTMEHIYEISIETILYALFFQSLIFIFIFKILKG